MADRTVSVRLQANVAGYMAAMRTAARSTEDFATRNRQQLETVGRGLLGIGTVATGALGFATKAAIDWESAWAGVTKTVDGSAQQLAQLEGELRQMATELPASHAEIAAVAEAAGQLGVQTESIADFTRVMIDLGETTNLTADEAATSIAQLMNVMGTAPEDVDNLGSALVALGNDGASTERDIVQMAQRIAGAGQIIGLTEGEVLGLANALASAGIRVEEGGSAISRIMTDIAKSVSQGSEDLTGFAQVAGLSAEEFAQRWQADPADALVTFIEGLGRVHEAGGDVFTTLEQLGQSDVRVSRALLGMAGSGDLLRESLELGNAAFEESTALSEEAAKRYDTAAAQISMAWGSIMDAAIEVGSVLAPIVAGMIGSVGDLADAFADLPGPVKGAVAILGSIVGAAGLAGGGLLLMLPRIAETRTAMRDLGLTTGRSGRALRGLGRAARIGGALFGAAAALEAVHQATMDATTGIGDMTNALADLRRGEVTEAIDNLLQKREDLADRSMWGDIATSIFGLGASMHSARQDTDELANELDVVNEVLVDMVNSGQADLAAETVEALAGQWEAAGGNVDHLMRMLGPYQDALEGVDGQQKNAADSGDRLGGEFDQQATALDRAKESLQEYRDKLRAMTDPVFALHDALNGVEEAQDAYNTAVEKYGKNSEEAQDASFVLAERLAALEQAALDGDLSFEEFSNKLDQWVADGKLTEAQAKQMRNRVKELRKEAEDAEGHYQIDVDADTSDASAAVADLVRQINNSQGFIRVGTRVVGPGIRSGPLEGAHGGLVTGTAIQRFPVGGFVTGPGGPREDLVAARLSPGEFVVQAPAVSAVGVDFMRELNAGRVSRGGDGPGVFTGNLFLDSGEFLGVVRGQVSHGISEHDRVLKRRTMAGTGMAR